MHNTNNVPKYGKFKGFLAENGIKQSEVSDLIGVTQAAFSMKISGAMEFTVEQIRKICDHYKISADVYFF